MSVGQPRNLSLIQLLKVAAPQMDEVGVWKKRTNAAKNYTDDAITSGKNRSTEM
jgi:hypothetical protein